MSMYVFIHQPACNIINLSNNFYIEAALIGLTVTKIYFQPLVKMDMEAIFAIHALLIKAQSIPELTSINAINAPPHKP